MAWTIRHRSRLHRGNLRGTAPQRVICCVDGPHSELARPTYAASPRISRSKADPRPGGATLNGDATAATGSLFIIDVRDRAETEISSSNDPFRVGTGRLLLQVTRKNAPATCENLCAEAPVYFAALDAGHLFSLRPRSRQRSVRSRAEVSDNDATILTPSST